jgi:hypothetical protein
METALKKSIVVGLCEILMNADQVEAQGQCFNWAVEPLPDWAACHTSADTQAKLACFAKLHGLNRSDLEFERRQIA